MKSSAEYVRRFRERQRQAHPKEPNWKDLEGRLRVVAGWLARGNPLPDSFIRILEELLQSVPKPTIPVPTSIPNVVPPKPKVAKPKVAKPKPTKEERAEKRRQQQTEYAKAYKEATEWLTFYIMGNVRLSVRCPVISHTWSENIFREKVETYQLLERSVIPWRKTTNVRYKKVTFTRTYTAEGVVEWCSYSAWRLTNREVGMAEHIAVLGLNKQLWEKCESEAARLKYLKQVRARGARKAHPDKGGSAEAFRAVQEAYEYLVRLTSCAVL